jgi:GMP synthase (glutamine-hydrolysing)
MDKIAVFDFGSQTTQLIGRRIRDIGIYSEVYPGNVPLEKLDIGDIKGIIFSGSPFSVYDDGAPRPDADIYNTGLPVLGICYGLQRITEDMGGRVSSHSTKEYGRSRLEFQNKNKLFHDIPDRFVSWMSHGDSIIEPAPGFTVLAQSENGHPAAIADLEKSIYGIQFHPEVTHCEYGMEILENFCCDICGSKKEWSMDQYLEEEIQNVREKAGNSKVLLLISGGVDSTVVAALLLKALGPDQVHLMYIDTGLMRKNETTFVSNNLQKLGAGHIHIIDASHDFLTDLKGISDPEKKRRIIGDMFIRVQEREMAKIHVEEAFLAQGTLYTDLIESGKGVGDKAQVIKSHHNVRSPLVEAKRKKGEIIEPLERLYKDEVRKLGRKLAVTEEIIGRHPFPGPGLGIRILGEITPEKCRILREADDIYISSLKERGLYDSIWQAFCILLPVRSVGVTGDSRDYGFVLSLRAVVSHDGMTADVFQMPYKDLLEISSIITNRVPEIGRVVYDISSKPPSTIEWE